MEATTTQQLEKINRSVPATTPDQLLKLAVDKDVDIDKLEKLLAMKERWDKEQARKSFFSALAEFQVHCPELRKTKEVNFGQTKYSYAPLGDIDRQIKQAMRDHELSKRWEIKDEGEMITVTCFITHVDGHMEHTSMQSKPDASGSKNPIQARGSAIEYMKRYTLIGALGITTADTDIDGRLPEVDINKLHKAYMDIYNQIIQIDSTWSTKMHPDNWSGEITADIYIKAIGRARKILSQL